MTALILSHAIALVGGIILGAGGIFLLAVALDPVRSAKRATRRGSAQ